MFFFGTLFLKNISFLFLSLDFKLIEKINNDMNDGIIEKYIKQVSSLTLILSHMSSMDEHINKRVRDSFVILLTFITFKISHFFIFFVSLINFLNVLENAINCKIKQKAKLIFISCCTCTISVINIWSFLRNLKFKFLFKISRLLDVYKIN